LSERAARVLRDIDITLGRGLEIGPLNCPFVVKRAGVNVGYVDVHGAEQLREIYAPHPGFPARDIVEVDYPLLDGGIMRSIAEVIACPGSFDWVVASHVIEHVPDVIGWLRDVAAVLVHGGLLSLVIPDRRYTFDALRPPTTLGQALQAHHDRDTRPSVRAVFDHHFDAVRVPPRDNWDEHSLENVERVHPMDYVQRVLAQAETTTTYLDAHVWVWTPQELLAQLRTLAELDLVDFTVYSIIPTPDNDIEFFLTLQRIPRNLDPDQRRLMLAAEHPALAPEEPPMPLAAAASSEVTPFEEHLIRVKRTVLGPITAPLRNIGRPKSEPPPG
jgi:SAM-dependent methyltransferase